jgi:hypothetical protein
MNKLPNWLSGSLGQVLMLLCVTAFLLITVPISMALRTGFAQAGPQGNYLGVAQQVGTTDTPTGTATPTASGTLTVTVTASVTRTPLLTPTTTTTPAATGTATGDKVTICHRTGSGTNPYVMITVSTNAIPAHTAHGDIIPAPPGGCPAGVTPSPSGTAATVTVTRTAVSTGTAVATRTPAATGTSIATRTPAATGTPQKVTICHRTGSGSNPYVLITVSVNAIPAHTKHGDIIPAPAAGCPATAPGARAQPGNAPRQNPGAGAPANNGNGNGNGQDKDKNKDKNKDNGKDKDKNNGGGGSKKP